MLAIFTTTVGSRHEETGGATDGSEDEGSGTVDAILKRFKDGSVPILAGAALLVWTVSGRKNRKFTAGRLLVASTLVAVGLRQRYRRSSDDDMPEETHHSGTGTFEQRADSHQEDTNPRGTAGEPDIETQTPGEDSVRFTEDQTGTTGSMPEGDTGSAGDPRVDDDDVTEIDLSEASMADEASEAAGPSSVQSQPTQTDEIEPEETPEADTSDSRPEGSDEDEHEADDSDDGSESDAEDEDDHEADAEDEDDEDDEKRIGDGVADGNEADDEPGDENGVDEQDDE